MRVHEAGSSDRVRENVQPLCSPLSETSVPTAATTEVPRERPERSAMPPLPRSWAATLHRRTAGTESAKTTAEERMARDTEYISIHRPEHSVTMTGFTSIAYYASFRIFLVGAVTILGILGVGNCIGRILRLPQPWLSTVGAIAATELLTLSVQFVSMAQVGTRGMLVGLWLTFSIVGFVLLVWERPRLKIAGFGSIGGAGS